MLYNSRGIVFYKRIRYNMKVTPELIARFLRQECTHEENDAVSEYFEQHPEELNKYLDEGDWEKFEADAGLHPAVSKKMLGAIERGIGQNINKRKTLVKPWLVAACLITAMGIGLIIGISKLKNNAVSLAAGLPAKYSIRQNNDTIFNSSNKPSTLSLPDGSYVVLYPNSRVYYPKPFTEKLRNIYLQGEAIFKVAKDKSRPFTVYSGNISTTALGTCFKVVCPANSKQVTVRLYEGKVLIKEQTKGTNGKDVFLTPGHEFMLDDAASISRVSEFNDKKIPEILANTDDNGAKEIRFKNEQLAKVIERLRLIYHIGIKADEAALRDKYFTGKINSTTEPAANVLNTIAMLNGLGLKKQAGVFILSAKAMQQNDTLKNKQ